MCRSFWLGVRLEFSILHMRRTILIVPGLLSAGEGDSFIRQSLPALSLLTELGTLRKLTTIPDVQTPEALLLGYRPDLVKMNQGPLTVSALGFDPPKRSTHFHLSLMSFHDGVASFPPVLPQPDEVDELLYAAKRLDTKRLTILKGEDLDHAMVWESLGDLGTTPAGKVDGQPMAQYLPEGDGEPAFRRLIDDSINFLSSLELNARRLDEGLPPFNLLWPWGQGVRTEVPNLAFTRGEPAMVESSSMRLAGLTRLAGYKHADRNAFGRGLGTKLRAIADRALNRPLTIVYIDAAAELRSRNKPEELDWFVRELNRELLQPLLDDVLKNNARLSLFSPAPLAGLGSPDMPASPTGLAAALESGPRGNNPYPFDERSLDERTIPSTDLWSQIESATTLPEFES